MNETPSWITRVEEYLRYRRNLGFALTNDAYDLRNFAKYAEQTGQPDPLTTAVAVQWALATEHKSANTLARRIEKLRGFFKYCQRFDSSTEIPPAGIFGTAHRRLIPHIFNEEELVALLRATDRLRPQGGLVQDGLRASCSNRSSYFGSGQPN
jgi:site-specific recombinase XerD